MEDNKTRILRGHINIMILKALEEGEKYGYEIGKYIENKSEGDYILKQPTLYSSLSRLEQKDILTSYWGDELDTNGGRRKYFRLTELGKTIAEKNISEWNEHRKLIDKIVSDKPKTAPTQNNVIFTETKSFNEIILNNNNNNNNNNNFLNTQNNDLNNVNTLNSNESSFSNINQNGYKSQAYGANTNENSALAQVKFADTEKNKQQNKDNEYKHVLSKLMFNVKNRKLDNNSLIKEETERAELFKQPSVVSEYNITREQPMHQHENTAQYKKDIEEIDINRSFKLNTAYAKPADAEEKTIINDIQLNRDYNIDSNKSNYNISTNSFLSKDNNLETSNSLIYNKESEIDEHKYSLLPLSNTIAQNSFTRLQRQMLQEGYTVRQHTNLKKESNQFLLDNKLSYVSMIFLYLIMALEIFLVYSIFESIIQIGLKYYFYAAAAFLAFPLAATVQYILAPNKRSRQKMDIKGYIVTSIMYYLTAVLFIVAIALIFKTNTGIQRDLILKIIIPCIVAANYIFYAIIKSIIYQTKKCHI